MWTQKLTDQLKLALVARKNKKKLTKTNASALLVQYKFRIHEGSPDPVSHHHCTDVSVKLHITAATPNGLKTD